MGLQLTAPFLQIVRPECLIRLTRDGHDWSQNLSSGEALLRQAMTELGLSARAHDKILRVARTIADIADSDSIRPEHVSEAIQYRRLDRQL